VRRALVVGIDDYPNSPLQGCCNDARRLSAVLERHADGQKNFDCVTLTSSPTTITRAVLREAIFELFRHPADVAYFHFSGHGTQHSLGGYLVTPDAEKFDLGIPMSEVLALANSTKAKEVFITLDCCHSGAFGTVPETGPEKVVLADEVSVITAARADQASLEETDGGVFTSLLVEALEGGAAGLLGEVSAAGVYAYIENALGAWDQRPLFKANVSRFTHLRRASSKLDIATLRRVTERFPLPAEDLQLSPDYEPSCEPHDDAKEACFADLVKYRHAGLVEPVGEEHMYYAAINSKTCRLTLLGRYYWRLVSEKKL
jgi:hypothetical protein